jgi:hypothetical protein
MRMRAALVVLALLAAGCTSSTSGHGRVIAACAPEFFGVAGSGQGLQNPPPDVLPEGVSQDDADRYGTTVGLLKTDLAQIAGARLESATPIDYPAIAVRRYIGPGGLTADLDTSEAQGVTSLVTAIRDSYRDGCDGRPVLLSGYSQGAEVVVLAVAQLTSREQAGVSVALFGNPSYQPGAKGDFPGQSPASGIRPSFRGVAYSLPATVRARTIDVCAPGDPVCGVDPTRTSVFGKVEFVLTHIKIHEDAYAFGPDGYPESAAKFLWDHRAGS